MRYKDYGDHFNRVVVDAMIQGTIPIARNYGMSGNAEGNGILFKPNKNYIMIPHDATPSEFADSVIYANNMTDSDAETIRFNNYNKLKHFDRKKVAQDYIDLANGKPCGYFNKIEVGTDDPKMMAESDRILNEFFYKKKIAQPEND